MHDIFGTEPDNFFSIFKTFGVMLVLAILTAAWFLYKELKRRADIGIFTPTKVKVIEGLPAKPLEIVSNAIFGFLLGFKGVYVAQHFAEFQADAGEVLLSMKGNWIAGIVGAGIFGYLRYWEKKKKELPKPKEVIDFVYPHDRIGDLTIVAAITGILGAKFFAVVESGPAFWQAPIETFFSGSGLAIYGGMIGGFLGLVWYLRKYNIPFWHVMDGVAVGYIIAVGVGRIGCQLSGDGDWGIVAAAQPEWWIFPEWLWSYTYPNNVNNDGGAGGFMSGLMANVDVECAQAALQEFRSGGLTSNEVNQICYKCSGVNYCHELKEPVYPTPIYETVMLVGMGLILWAFRKRWTIIPGLLFFVTIILNGIERWFIEKIRVNVEFMNTGMTQAELISIGMVIAGLIGAYWVYRNYKKGQTA